MNIGDVLQISHKYSVAGESCLNVFYYEVMTGTTITSEPFVFLDELSFVWATALQPVWGVDVASEEIKAENLTNGLEVSDFSTGWGGTIAVNVLPPFNAIAVKLSRDTKLTRNGAKRISGLTEDASINGNLSLSAAQLAGIESYCASSYFFQDVDGNGNDVVLAQRIVGRTKNAAGVYELDLSKLNAITGIVVNSRITSQTSRKG